MSPELSPAAKDSKMDRVLASIIDRDSDDRTFSYINLPPDNVQACWMPVYQFGKAKYQLGIVEGGNWAVVAGSKVFRLSEPHLFTYLLAILEDPIAKVCTSLSHFFCSKSIDGNIFDLFPFHYVVKAGFSRGSIYWAELAFVWYYELPQDQKEALESSLQKIVDATWASQKLRQKAQQEIYSFRTSGKGQS